jgi:hypothetical protein
MRCRSLILTYGITLSADDQQRYRQVFYWLGIAALSMNSQVYYLVVGIAVLESQRFC